MRTNGDPVGLSGTIIRVNPSTGAGMPDNWFGPSPDLNKRRVIAYGLRNPFRFTFRPGTSELWIGDVGALSWEEFNRVVNPKQAPRNFGWPCYEGPNKNVQFDSLELTLCENLYADGTAHGPYYAYPRGSRVVPGDPCPDGQIPGAVISGAAFYPTTGGPFPAAYRRALFFSDYGRKCIWAMRAGADGLPDATQIETFASGLAGPVDLKIGPDGGLYYVGFDDGEHPSNNRWPACGRDGRSDIGRGSSHGRLRRFGIDRPEGRRARVRLGPRRGRHVRRLDRGRAVPHVHPKRGR